MENYKIPDSRINSPGRHYFRRSPRDARLNGSLSWCSFGQTYLHIDLGRTFKVTSIATQGGRMDTGGKWVKQYKVAFYAGATRVMYSESGLEKVRNLRLHCKPHIFLYHYISVFFLLLRLIIYCWVYVLQVTYDCDTMHVLWGLLFRFSGSYNRNRVV